VVENLTASEECLQRLQQTIQFAVKTIPYYRDRAARYSKPVNTTQDLENFPFVEPESFVSDPRSFCSSSQWPDSISFSSATTGSIGRSRWHLKTEKEAQSGYGQRATNASGITLVIHPFDQGAPLQIEEKPNTIYLPFFVPWHYELILNTLESGWSSPMGRLHVSHILAFSPALRILTTWLAEQDKDPATFGVKEVAGYGSIQPPVWRRRLKTRWHAHYTDLYGLSEVKAIADTCPICDNCHFLYPVIPEVVDSASRQLVKQGVGVLVLTELMPFAQLQLLIRYWTGDLVEIMSPCMLSSFGFKFRGRLADSVILTPSNGRATKIAIGSLQTGEICSEFPDIAVTRIPWASSFEDVGAPRFFLSGSNNTVSIVVELRFSPELFQERSDQLIRSLRQTILREVTGLGAVVEAGQVFLEIESVGPGRLLQLTNV
jgi:phenylacetate-coenzyme A ligase PaaK-like adenylate-forming protein